MDAAAMTLPLSLMRQRKQELITPLGRRLDDKGRRLCPRLWALYLEREAMRRAIPRFVVMNTPFQETHWGPDDGLRGRPRT